MKDELQVALVKDFPHVFYRDPIPGREPWSMFGFECSDGWEPLLREAATKLEPLFAQGIANDPEGFKFGYYRTSQIKEKYGTLRWYLSGGTEEMEAIINKAEIKSHKTCEQCGKKGKVRGHGWLYCACFEHTELEDRDNFEVVKEAHKKHSRKKRNEKKS